MSGGRGGGEMKIKLKIFSMNGWEILFWLEGFGVFVEGWEGVGGWVDR